MHTIASYVWLAIYLIIRSVLCMRASSKCWIFQFCSTTCCYPPSPMAGKSKWAPSPSPSPVLLCWADHGWQNHLLSFAVQRQHRFEMHGRTTASVAESTHWNVQGRLTFFLIDGAVLKRSFQRKLVMEKQILCRFDPFSDFFNILNASGKFRTFKIFWAICWLSAKLPLSFVFHIPIPFRHWRNFVYCFNISILVSYKLFDSSCALSFLIWIN